MAGWTEEEDDDDDEDVDDTGEDTFLEGALAMDAVPFDTGIAKSSTVLGKVCYIGFHGNKREVEKTKEFNFTVHKVTMVTSYYL